MVATARDAGAEARLWLCHPDWRTVAGWRELSPEVKLVESTRAKRLEGSPELHVARSAEAGIDVLNMHHTDWNGGLVAMVHRFERARLRVGRAARAGARELLRSGIDGVYSDHVDRMVTRARPARLSLEQAQAVRAARPRRRPRPTMESSSMGPK